MRPHHNIRPIATAILIPYLLASAGCAPAQYPPQRHPPQSAAAWEGRLKNLFDDSIDRSAVGFAHESASHADGLIGQRAREAHFILRVRTATVTTQGSGPNLQYLITLRVVGEPVAGPRLPNDEIEVVIGREASGFGVAKAMDLELAGTQFIAFFREFADRGKLLLHWHLARDGEDVAAAARKGAILSEVSSH